MNFNFPFFCVLSAFLGAGVPCVSPKGRKTILGQTKAVSGTVFAGTSWWTVVSRQAGKVTKSCQCRGCYGSPSKGN